MFLTFWFVNALVATAACHFSTMSRPLNIQKWSVPLSFLTFWLCASRQSGVQFFDIATSKNGPPLRCFVHFHLKMHFSLQRRAIFQHLNFKKCSEHAVFCTFWLQNVLLATAACNFCTLQLQKVVRARQFFNILTLKCASRHSGVQFFHIATSKSGPNM